MPAPGRTPQQRAEEALAKLTEQGGDESLPTVLKSKDVIPLMGRGWLSDAMRLDMMPGIRVRRGGVWRCERGTYLAWLRRLAAGDAILISPQETHTNGSGENASSNANRITTIR